MLGEEEGRRHLPIRTAFGDEPGYPRLGLRQPTARRCTAADPCQLGPRLLGPEGGAERFEAGECLLERRARLAAALRAPLCAAERQERAGVVERVGSSLVLGECPLEAREGVLEFSPGGVEKRAAAGENRDRPGPVHRARPLFPFGDDPFGLAELTRGDERLEQVTELQALRRLEHEVVSQAVGAS